MKVYWQCFKPQLKLFILDLLCLAVDITMELFLPYLMAIIMDQGVKLQNLSLILGYGGLMAGLASVALVFGALAMWCSAKISNGFCYELRRRMFVKIQTFSFKNIDHFEVPSLVTRLTSDVNSFRMAVMMMTRVGLKAPLTIMISAVFMFMMNVKLAAIVLGIATLLCFVIVFIVVKSTPVFRKLQVKLDDVNRVVEEDVDGIRVVKSFVREDFEAARFAGANSRLKAKAVQANQTVALNLPIILFAINITTALILYFGGVDVAAFEQTGFESGQLFSFVNYSVMILMAFNMISNLIMNLARAGASKERIDEIFAEVVDISYEPKKTDSDFDPSVLEDGSVEFKDAVFSYCDDLAKAAVGPLSLKINSGEIIGIVGPTGSGKTTLVSLIPRLYDPSSGSIMVGGHDVRDYDLDALRREIGVVTQKNVLFSGTIKENLLWGKQNASDVEIWEALKMAQADDFVKALKDGEETLLTQGGTSVSGGQKQRLAIARAMIKKPKILILDDATSAVDVATESRIKDAFYNSLKGTTVFLIAQRVTSVMDADRIIVLENGRVDAVGTHFELLKSSRVYREIYESQKKAVI